MDVLLYNRDAWDKEVGNQNVWTVPVDSDRVMRARQGEWSVVLTPRRPVPREWFPDLEGATVLCLASGGGLSLGITVRPGALYAMAGYGCYGTPTG